MLFPLGRWWGRYGVQILLAGAALTAAWFLRQTNGAAILETYYWLTRPFHGEPRAELLANAEMIELQERLIELESQNQQLRQLLQYEQADASDGLIAPVIGRSADYWWQQVTLGKGSTDGAQVGDVVTGAGGLVGRVISTTPNTSRVLLVTDPLSRVGITISHVRNGERPMGYLRGQGNNRAVITFFEKLPDVQPGDVVSTSQISQLFPPGVPVGRIESVDVNKSPAPEAIVIFSAPVSYLEWVEISPNTKLNTLDKPQADVVAPDIQLPDPQVNEVQ